MFHILKTKIWEILRGKDVSLAMIYDREGRILWHSGRRITGTSVINGSGFCKSYILASIEKPDRIDIDDVMKSSPERLSDSAVSLRVRSVIIHPVQENLFLYVDSGKKDSFSEADRAAFAIIGDLMERYIFKVIHEATESGITGSSPAARDIGEQVIRYAIEEEPVLLSGETGVGKTRLARLIHRHSGRQGRLVIADAPNISDNLFESKLFGHKKGAFTDARFDKAGLVDEARAGTLFLDEITEIPLSVQAKLLRFMDSRRFYTLGESVEKEADVRIIAATNREPAGAVDEGILRKDLYYRLNVLHIEIPPLRERKTDIDQIIDENLHLLRGNTLGPDARTLLRNHDWPGNLRELMNVLKRAGILVDGEITPEDIRSLLDSPHSADGAMISRQWEVPMREISRGVDFWQAVWRPFMDRELDRGAVKAILREYFQESGRHFKNMLHLINLPPEDYQKFMSLLYKYRIDPRK